MHKLVIWSGVALMTCVGGQAEQGERSVQPNRAAFVGCVNRATQSGSLGAMPGVPPARPETAPVQANAGLPTGLFLLNGARPANANDDVRSEPASHPEEAGPTTYVLDGTSEQLERHAGQWVEVTGTVRLLHEGGPSTGSDVKHLQVASIRMLTASCPPKGAAESTGRP